MGERSFYVHSFSVLAIVGTLVYILFNHLYEYQYAFDHVNNAMPMKYVLSAMWEGQGGDFFAVDILACGIGDSVNTLVEKLGTMGHGSFGND